ncbi:MAG: hypothetical protein ACTS41_01705 [Candidatus Hodgkinia cicadicola]
MFNANIVSSAALVSLPHNRRLNSQRNKFNTFNVWEFITNFR